MGLRQRGRQIAEPQQVDGGPRGALRDALLV